MLQTIGYRIGPHQKSGRKFNDKEPDYSHIGEELLESFSERLEATVDGERLLPDEYSVAFMSMKLGLCLIESSEKDVVELRNDIFLGNCPERLRETLLKELETGRFFEKDQLNSLGTVEILETYRKVYRY